MKFRVNFTKAGLRTGNYAVSRIKGIFVPRLMHSLLLSFFQNEPLPFPTFASPGAILYFFKWLRCLRARFEVRGATIRRIFSKQFLFIPRRKLERCSCTKTRNLGRISFRSPKHFHRMRLRPCWFSKNALRSVFSPHFLSTAARDFSTGPENIFA